jgi:ribonuclease-3
METLEEKLGYRFKDRDRLERALTHRSFAYEKREPGLRDYERLEFLGDAVLGFVVSDRLSRDDPSASEGVLTRRKQSVVRKETLAESARALGLGEALRLGRGEESSGGRRKASLLADTFEAVVGAIYSDGGLRAARSFVLRQLREVIRVSGGMSDVADDYKTRFQEKVQGRSRVTPRYRMVATSGPPHDRRFEVEVVVGDTVVGRGNGSTRKQAEQEAARQALGGWELDES